MQPQEIERREASARELLDAARPRRLSLPDRSVEIALLDWGGDGPLALLHHANGFCKGVWGLVAAELRRDFRVVALDARGHGDSSRPEGPRAYAWDEIALDLVAVAETLVREQGCERVALGVGHSFGGTSFLGAARRRPELFARLVLVDPVVPPPPRVDTPERRARVRGLAQRARKRRADFASRDEARAFWAERELFQDWEPRALDLYVLDGLRECADGSLELKCPGEVEAAVFSAGVGFDVPALASGVVTPCLFLWAAHGDFARAVYQNVAASMTRASVESVDAGHLVPMERPDLVVDAVRGFVARAASGE